MYNLVEIGYNIMLHSVVLKGKIDARHTDISAYYYYYLWNSRVDNNTINYLCKGQDHYKV